MLKKIALLVVMVLVALAAFIATRPSAYEVTRARVVSAPPEVVYEHVSDFHKWSAWSPWEKLDPEMRRTFSGAEAGEGATYGWAGNSDVGEGRMTITEATAPKNVTIRLEFVEPFESTSTTVFDLAAVDGGTQVTWTMSGRNNYIAKAFGLFVDVDQMIGNDFEQGLENLDSVTAHAAAAAAPASTEENDEPAAS